VLLNKDGYNGIQRQRIQFNQKKLHFIHVHKETQNAHRNCPQNEMKLKKTVTKLFFVSVSFQCAESLTHAISRAKQPHVSKRDLNLMQNERGANSDTIASLTLSAIKKQPRRHYVDTEYIGTSPPPATALLQQSN